MASTLAHPLFRPSSIDQAVHVGAHGMMDNEMGQYHTAIPTTRIPSPLPSGPMFLKESSRSSSGSTQASGSIGHLLFQPNFHTRSASLSAGRVEEYNRQQSSRATLPGLNTLASLAGTREHQLLRSFSASTVASTIPYNSMPTVPTPGISGNNSMPPVCQNCETSTTPLWRRDESGSVLCNACGLFLKLHGRPRPISLKTDVIKSRNRVKSANQGPKKFPHHQSLPASQSVDVMQNGAHRRVSQMSALSHSQRSQSPISRTGTPSNHHDPNIAPQHMFDGVSLQDHVFQTPALPNLGSHPSPGSMLMFNDRQPDGMMNYEQLIAQNTLLKTRVSELEVINMMYSDNENNLRRERDDAVKAHDDLKRRLEEHEQQQQQQQQQHTDDPDLPHPGKKPRLNSAGTTEKIEYTTLQEELVSASMTAVQNPE